MYFILRIFLYLKGRNKKDTNQFLNIFGEFKNDFPHEVFNFYFTDLLQSECIHTAHG